jgi:hypothetical protein
MYWQLAWKCSVRDVEFANWICVEIYPAPIKHVDDGSFDAKVAMNWLGWLPKSFNQWITNKFVPTQTHRLILM